MIPPQVIMLAAQLAMQGANMAFQGLNAKKQEKEGREMSGKYPRPLFKTPPQIAEVVKNSRNLATNPDLIGADTLRKQQASLSAGAAQNMLNAGADAGQVMAGLTGLNNNANKAAQNIQQEQNLQRLRGIEALNNALNTEAEFDLKEFDYNKNQPYQNAQMAAQAQIAASQKQKDNMANLATVGGLGINTQMWQLMNDPNFMKMLANKDFVTMLNGLFKKGAKGGALGGGGTGVSNPTDNSLTKGLTELPFGINANTLPTTVTEQSPFLNLINPDILKYIPK